jgi:hypothetical protein
MSGFTAGLVSILTLIVAGSIFATFLKNPQGTEALIGTTGTAFTNALVASQGSVSTLQSYNGY